MIKERQLSKLDILISFIRNIRGFIPFIIIFGINIQKLDDVPKIIGVSIGAIVLLIINFMFAYLGWKKFKYSLEQDRIIIHKGIFKREEKTIYYRRIHSVNVQQPLLLRIFGLASLQIETPGGKPGVAEAELKVLKHSYALELQAQLRQLRAAGMERNDQDNSLAGMEQSVEDKSIAGMEQSVEDNLGDPFLDSSLSANHVNTTNQSASSERKLERNIDFAEEQIYHYQYGISAGQLLKASITSLNLSVALIFIFGIFSFADDVLDVISPNLYDTLLDNAINQYSGLPLLAILITTIVVMLFMWLLSIVLYLIKFGDYGINRKDEQISVSYGLLEKKSFIFDQSKIQAVIMEENPLRQWLGFAELKVQVITSNAMEQLVIHPFVRKKDIPQIMEQLLPDRELDLRDKLHSPPKNAFRTYAAMPLIFGLILTGAALWFWKWNGLWVFLLVPALMGWSWICMRSAGVLLEDGKLVLRKRKINRVTYFVERRNMITVSTKSSPMQRKLKLSSIHVQVLGSTFAYRVKSIHEEHIIPIWQWFSRRNR